MSAPDGPPARVGSAISDDLAARLQSLRQQIGVTESIRDRLAQQLPATAANNAAADTTATEAPLLAAAPAAGAPAIPASAPAALAALAPAAPTAPAASADAEGLPGRSQLDMRDEAPAASSAAVSLKEEVEELGAAHHDDDVIAGIWSDSDEAEEEAAFAAGHAVQMKRLIEGQAGLFRRSHSVQQPVHPSSPAEPLPHQPVPSAAASLQLYRTTAACILREGCALGSNKLGELGVGVVITVLEERSVSEPLSERVGHQQIRVRTADGWISKTSARSGRLLLEPVRVDERRIQLDKRDRQPATASPARPTGATGDPWNRSGPHARHPRYKTSLCPGCMVGNGGSCRFGAACGFAHGQHELRELSAKPTAHGVPLADNPLADAGFHAFRSLLQRAASSTPAVPRKVQQARVAPRDTHMAAHLVAMARAMARAMAQAMARTANTHDGMMWPNPSWPILRRSAAVAADSDAFCQVCQEQIPWRDFPQQSAIISEQMSAIISEHKSGWYHQALIAEVRSTRNDMISDQVISDQEDCDEHWSNDTTAVPVDAAAPVVASPAGAVAAAATVAGTADAETAGAARPPDPGIEDTVRDAIFTEAGPLGIDFRFAAPTVLTCLHLS